MEHQSFWKPEKVIKEKKQWKPGQKPKREIPEWKKDILSHHQSTPSKADRAEFPLSVVKEAIVISGGKCQQCHTADCTTTHHIWGRGRGGRGVLKNAFRSCGTCHIEIEADDEKKQAIIDLYIKKYGEHFWFDEQDWTEYNAKQTAIEEAEKDKLHELERIEPVVNLLTAAAGRKLKAKEVRIISGLDAQAMVTFAKLMSDVVGAGLVPKGEYGYGKFND